MNLRVDIFCKCESCYINGGNEYLRFGGKDFSKFLIIFDGDTEVLASDEENYKKNYEKWENNKYKNIDNFSSNKRDRKEE